MCSSDLIISTGSGHTSDMIPACLAVAEAQNASGRDLLLSIIAAYEVYAGLADVIPVRDLGWDQGFFVVLGSAAGAAKLLKLTHAQIADALAIANALQSAREAFVSVVDFIAGQSKANPNAVYGSSVPYLMLTGNLVAGWQMGRAFLVAQALHAQGEDAPFMQAKMVTARFYADHILSKVAGMAHGITTGADSVTAMALESF